MAGNGEKEIIEGGMQSLPVIGIPIGLLLGWLVSSFRYGKKYGKDQATLMLHTNDIAKLRTNLGTMEAELKLEVKAMMEPISKAIDEIRGQFFTQDNEPRLISYKAHDKIQQACQMHILAEFGHVVSAVSKLERKLDDIESSIQDEMKDLRDEVISIKIKS